MPKQRDAFKLGVTLLVVLALFLGVLFFLASRGPTGQHVTVRFRHDAAGMPVLKPGAQVRCGGTQVGTVRRVELREAAAPASRQTPGGAESKPAERQLYLYVEAEVDEAVGLRTDCRIAAEGPALGGTGWLVIESRGTAPKLLGEHDLVEGQPPGGFAAVTDKLNDLAAALQAELDASRPNSLMATIKAQLNATDATSLLGKIHKSLDDIGAMTSSMRGQFDPREQATLLGKLHASLNHINQITAELRDQLASARDDAMLAKVHRALDTLNAGLRNAAEMLRENREPLHQTLEHLRRTSEQLDAGIAKRIARQLDPDNAAGLIAKIHVGLNRLNASLADINQVTDTTRQLVVLNREKLDELLTNFKQTSEHLKAAAKDIRRNPWRLLYRPSPQEIDRLSVFDAARAFAEAAAELDDAVADLRALAEAQNGQLRADDPQLQRIRARLAETFEKFTQAEAALWQQLKIH